MAADKQQVHRPGVFKQQNKSHKHGKHRSKGSLERENRGIHLPHVLLSYLPVYSICTVLIKIFMLVVNFWVITYNLYIWSLN